MRFTLIALALVAFAPSSAYAEIYKYVDESGRITYTNIPKKGASKLDIEPLSTIPSAPRPKAAPATASATPASFPKIDTDTQKKRDDMRRRLLEDELSNEQKALTAARQALQEGEATRLGGERNYQKYLDRIQGLRDTVTLHEKSIEALQKELSALR